MLRIATNLPDAEWDAYVQRHPDSTRYHPACWRRVFVDAFSHEPVYLAATRGASVVGVLPLVSFRSLLFGRFLVSLPFVNYGGIVADDDEARSALLEASRAEAVRRGAAHVELRHTTRQFAQLPVRQHKVAMTRELPADEQAAWRSLDHKVRNQVRKAEKSGLQAIAGGSELLDDFYAVFARNMRDLGTPVYSRALFAHVLARVPDVRVHVVRLGQEPVAAGITIGYRDAIENPWASSSRQHRPLCPNMLLMWSMFRAAIAGGYRVFDFGRSTPEGGTYHFKKQWGAAESPFYWEYVITGRHGLPDLDPNNSKFRLATAAWRHLPLPVANAWGPHLVRSIP